MTSMMMKEMHGKTNTPKNASPTAWTWTPKKGKKDGRKTKNYSMKIMTKMTRRGLMDS